jgi:putative transposase
MTPERSSYRRHRFPAEIISHAVWLYHVFSLSLRDVELILAERGVAVTHEGIRHRCKKFGEEFARRLRRRRPRETPGIWMRCSSGSALRSIISGARWISTGSCWTSWCRRNAMALLPNASSDAC